jgi:uncharacterized phiE125 gp8 family phage protein
MISKKLITEPAEEPVTLYEAKNHLYLDTSPPTAHPDDTMIEGLIIAAREWAESFQQRAYITQTWEIYLQEFPQDGSREILLPLPPLQYVVSLSYYDGSATQVVSFLDPSGTPMMETTDFIVDETTQPGRLCLKNGASWPTALKQNKSVQIRYVAGYGLAASVPKRVISAIKMKLTDLYENRGDAEPGANFERAAHALLWPKRIIPF